MASMDLVMVKNTYRIGENARSADLGKLWDKISTAFCSSLRDKADFVAGMRDLTQVKYHRAIFEKFENVYEVRFPIAPSVGGNLLEITCLNGDFQYAQKDIAEIVELITPLFEKNENPREILRET
jgi:hypothetical protein